MEDMWVEELPDGEVWLYNSDEIVVAIYGCMHDWVDAGYEPFGVRELKVHPVLDVDVEVLQLDELMDDDELSRFDIQRMPSGFYTSPKFPCLLRDKDIIMRRDEFDDILLPQGIDWAVSHGLVPVISNNLAPMVRGDI